ncbi:MAG: hypothetical protein ACXV95_03950 [Acidimicrobiales bacterium]
MVLATVDSTGYKIVLILHIVAVIVGFGGLFLAPMLRRADASAASIAGVVLAYVQRVAVPAVAVAGILGFAMIGMSDKSWKFSQRWVGIAILLWTVELAVLWFGVGATEKKVAAGDTEAEARLPMFSGISHLLLLVLVYLMVFKPGI